MNSLYAICIHVYYGERYPLPMLMTCVLPKDKRFKLILNLLPLVIQVTASWF